MRNADKALLAEFFGARPDLMPQFWTAHDRLTAAFPGARPRVEAHRIAYCDPDGFAYVWVPPANGAQPRLVLSFVLPRRVEHARIVASTFVRPDRVTHHVPLTANEGVDRQVLLWLREAHRLTREIGRRAGESGRSK